MKGLKQVLRNRYNVSIAEVDFKDQWARSRIAVCIVGDDTRFVNTQLNEVVNFCERHGEAQLTDYAIEML